MSTALHLVYQYRQLAVKCEHRGLDMEEVELLETIEALFRRSAPESRRLSTREDVAMVAELRAHGRRDRIAIDNLSLGGMVCYNVRSADVGNTVEIVIEDPELSLSYRFKADVCWSQQSDGAERCIGVSFCGSPLLLRHPPPEIDARHGLDARHDLDATTAEFDVNTEVDTDCAAA